MLIFYLYHQKTMYLKSQLSHLLVKELQKRNALEDVILDYEIETLRVCNCCGRLMNEGWIYQGIETYCSDDCLMKSHPNENLCDIKEQACLENSDIYWTQWEG